MEIRDYSPGDEVAIGTLFQRAFRRPLDSKFWHWRYLQNPVQQVLIKLAWEGDTLAGHYAVSPQHLLIEGSPLPAALSMTTMTDPAFEGRGLFTQLSAAVYADMETRHGMGAVYGFPNNNSHYAFVRKLDWKDIAVLPLLRLFPEDTFLKRAIAPMPLQQGGAFNARHAAALATAAQAFAVQVHRTPEWLQWRYTHNPTAEYHILEQPDSDSFVVAKCFDSFTAPGKKDIDILEASLPRPDVLPEFIAGVLAAFAPHAVHQLSLWLPVYHPHHTHLERVGFTVGPHLTYLGVRAFNAGSPFANRLEDPRAWYYSLGTSDVF